MNGVGWRGGNGGRSASEVDDGVIGETGARAGTILVSRTKITIAAETVCLGGGFLLRLRRPRIDGKMVRRIYLSTIPAHDGSIRAIAGCAAVVNIIAVRTKGCASAGSYDGIRRRWSWRDRFARRQRPLRS